VSAPLVVVTGVGTGVGKTHVAEAILRSWGRGAKVAGWKPVETGVPEAVGPEDDGGRLEAASTFHVKHSELGVRLRTPVSPHLAAEREGRVLDPNVWMLTIARLRDACEGLVVELAGGLFSPITPLVTNADLLARLEPTKTLLVAVDRLGVLHEVIATSRAFGRPLDVLLIAPTTADASTGTNATELRRLCAHPVLGPLPRASVGVLADHPAIASLISEVRVSRAPS
jgi:dethiobiotin synthetase